MNYGKWNKCDFVNGKGLRTSLFVTGCSHHCKGCWNKSIWSFESGYEFTEEVAKEIINYIKNNPCIKGLSLLGGEPFDNLELIEFVKEFKKICPDRDIWIWSGYTFEDILKDKNKIELIKLCDILVDGKFEIDRKNLSLKFRGSENQRIINIKESLELGELNLSTLN